MITSRLMIIEKKPVNSPWGKIELCPFCDSELVHEYFMGMQLFNYECMNCALEDIDNHEDKPKYKVQLWWGEHIGQNHKWVRIITDNDGTEHVDEQIVLNEHQ